MRKGQEWIGGLFSLLLAGIIAGIALPLILPGQATKVTPEVEANEFENKAIILANSLIGNQNLLYFDSTTGSYRTNLFDKVKLDSVPSSIDADTSFIGLSSPETFSVVVITDKETGKIWSFYLKDGESENVKRIIDCWKIETDDPFGKCSKRFSEILDDGFPVTIKYLEGEVHIGIMTVTVVE